MARPASNGDEMTCAVPCSPTFLVGMLTMIKLTSGVPAMGEPTNPAHVSTVDELQPLARTGSLTTG